jgi:hypothetical protein
VGADFANVRDGRPEADTLALEAAERRAGTAVTGDLLVVVRRQPDSRQAAIEGEVLGKRSVDVELGARLLIRVAILGVEVGTDERGRLDAFCYPKYMKPTTGSMVQKFLPVLARRPTAQLPVGA